MEWLDFLLFMFCVSTTDFYFVITMKFTENILELWQ